MNRVSIITDCSDLTVRSFAGAPYGYSVTCKCWWFVLQMTINLPSNKLKAVTSTGVGDLVVNPGFNTTGTTISSQGTGSVSVRGMATQNLTIHNSG